MPNNAVPTQLEKLVTDIKYVLGELGNKGLNPMTVLDAAQIVEQANRVFIVSKDTNVITGGD